MPDVNRQKCHKCETQIVATKFTDTKKGLVMQRRDLSRAEAIPTTRANFSCVEP